MEIRIIQQTPIIHFEAKKNIPLIMLRASELKPRITKFIKEEFLDYYDGDKKEEFKNLINNKEIFPKKRGSPFFKIKIDPYLADIIKFNTYISKKDKKDFRFVEIGSYFAKSLGVKFKNEIKIEIFSYIKPLQELVKEAFKYFFVLYNLGMRQSKGFGGFIVKGTTQKEFEEILKKKYKTLFKKTSSKPLKTILEDYQILKSGKNTPYIKSYLFEYFASKNIGWEKRRIKEEIVNKCPDEVDNIKGLKRHASKRIFDEYRYIRAMLGLAGNISFKKSNKEVFKINVSHHKNNSNESNEKCIKKFASPVLFKVYGNRVYALPNKIPSKIFNQKFVFKASKKDCGRDKFLCELYTPKEFDLENFLSEYLTKLNWSRL